MSQVYCPNCRTKRPAGDTPCRHCGWMPLRSTELQFIEAEMVACPQCSEQRPVADEKCPHCGNRDVLESLERHTSNFHISSLLLLTTLVAFCLALARISLGFAILVSGIVGLATLRTVLLIRERKRHRYPVYPAVLLQLGGRSVLGITAALLVFLTTGAMSQFVFGAFFGMLVWQSEAVALVFLSLTVMAAVTGAVVLEVRRGASHKILLVGGAVAFGPGLFVIAAAASGLRADSVALLTLLPYAAIAITALCLGCRREGGAQVRSFIVGCTVGLSTLGGLVLLSSNGRLYEFIAFSFGMSGVLLWPTLLSIMTLEKILSWDNAFPAVTTHTRRLPDFRRPGTMPVFTMDKEPGIEFADESVDDDEPPHSEEKRRKSS